MKHSTPLPVHFKDSHFWLDIGLLMALFVVAYFIPILKIVPLVASLELLGFFSFHLFAKRHSLKLQGFLGGIISSTAVFLQVLNDPKFSRLNNRELISTVLLAVCAMLLECLFILLFFASQLPLLYYLPLLTQLGFFVAVLIVLEWQPQQDITANTEAELALAMDHPILWKNVAKLSMFIIFMVTLMNFMGNRFGFPREISTLLIALFEAHAILAATLSEWSLQPHHINLLQMVFVILLGNTLSKSYLAWQSVNLARRWPLIGILIGSFATSLAATGLWLFFNPQALPS